MNAIIYTRVSTDDQADKGHSLPFQEEFLRQYCQIKKYNVLEHYQDDYSAKNFERPAFKKLFAYCQKNKTKVDVILFTRWDRFSRNLEEALRMIRKFRDMGIQINSAANPLELDSPDSKLLLAVFLTIPEVENDKNSIRTTEGMRMAKKLGCWVGTAPYGYKNCRNAEGKSTLEITENAHLVREAYMLVSKGTYSMNEVRLVMMKKGMRFHKQSFLDLLKNRAYTGKIVVPEWKKESAKTVKGLHPAIIDEELFERVQDVVLGRSRLNLVRDIDNENLVLRHFLLCPRCGRVLTGSGSRNRAKNLYYYYHCQDGCKERFPAIHANELMIDYLNDFSFERDIQKTFIRMIRERLNPAHDVKVKRINEVEETISTLTSRSRTLQNKFLDGQIENNDYLEMKQRLESERVELEKQKSDLLTSDENLEKFLAKGLSIIQNVSNTYRTSQIGRKRRILRVLFPNRLIFEKSTYRTQQPNEVLSLIASFNKAFRKNKSLNKEALSSWAPPAGLEPATL